MSNEYHQNLEDKYYKKEIVWIWKSFSKNFIETHEPYQYARIKKIQICNKHKIIGRLGKLDIVKNDNICSCNSFLIDLILLDDYE